MSPSRISRLAASLLLTLALLAACGGSAPTTAPAAVPTTAAAQPAGETTIRLGYVPVMIYAPLYVGIERGYFAAEGIKIESTAIQGGSEAVVQLAAGNFDASLGGAGAGLFNAASRGVKFTIVAPMHSEKAPLTSPLVISAKRTGEFKSIADLKGKKVAINATGAATEYWLAQALAKGGLTINDVQVTTVSFAQVPAALESGSLDAAILGEPLATINMDKGIVAILSNDFIDGFYATYLYMGDKLLTEKPEVAKGFLRAYLRACRDLQGKYMSPEIAAIIEKYTKVPAAVVLRASPAQYDPNGVVPIANLNTLQDYFMSRGLLEFKQPLDVTKFVNTTLAAEAAKELDATK
ncbi:MAG: ABC transporter substrate-binding protein [Roseiflexaceae bacterium]|nr:ABC transporter substrate-binding protein [Roseiflexaceae bacterium]